MIKIDSAICGQFETASSREWLETNGIGGYASSSISGANTRRYHGLLVAATRPPLGRMVLLSKFEETLVIDGVRYELSSNQYPDKVHPVGVQYLREFRLDPFPVWTFEAAGVELEKRLFMIHGENTAVISWSVTRNSSAAAQIDLELRPLLAFRDHHHLRHEEGNFRGEFVTAPNVISITPYEEMASLFLAHNAKVVEPQGYWYHNFEYAIEKERGFDFTEDLFQPCVIKFDLGEKAVVIASTEAKQVSDADLFESAEVARRKSLNEQAGVSDEFTNALVQAADQFIVERGTGNTVIAGYHWFSDWGRDTMIALNGLTLATNRTEIAKSILIEFSKHISEGMLPNRFPDAGEVPEYNTVDATLWFFEAIRAFVVKTGDYDLIRDEFYEKLVDIIDRHIAGTRYNIRVDADGLLNAGEPGVQLTWMDAKIGDWVVTPRTGKAVEIQALWYNALCVMAGFAKKFEDAKRQDVYEIMAARAKKSFNARFWNQAAECLFDVVNENGADDAIRPNQIFAVSLPYSMLTAAKARKVVEKVETDLLTPVGLRSLSPDDANYVPIYIGTPFQRDAAYHQGTVWSWLIGPFVDAYRKVHIKDAKSRQRVDEIIAGFKLHMTDAMTGQVSEIFDAEAPHTARGCGAQAWSVAELLRISR